MTGAPTATQALTGSLRKRGHALADVAVQRRALDAIPLAGSFADAVARAGDAPLRAVTIDVPPDQPRQAL